MKFWDALTGRRPVAQPDLDALFGIPGAAITLQAAAGFLPTGVGSVCFRAASGAAFDVMQRDVIELIQGDPEKPDVEVSQDDFGFTWLVVRRDPAEVPALCTDLHAVNTTLVDQGFASGLLCTMVPFADPGGQRFGLVYLYKQGTFYAFAPKTGPGDAAPGAERARDNLLEIAVRDMLAGELPMERELSRWLAVWGAPGL